MDTLIGGLVIVVFALVGLMLYETPLAQWGRILFRWWLALLTLRVLGGQSSLRNHRIVITRLSGIVRGRWCMGLGPEVREPT
jgi:hypothetical protein